MTYSFIFVLVVTAENGRLRLIERIAQRFSKLTMAHRGEVQAIVTSVIVSLTLDMSLPTPPQTHTHTHTPYAALGQLFPPDTYVYLSTLG